MKPYKNLETANLGLVLMLARALAVLGLLGVFFALLSVVLALADNAFSTSNISIATPFIGLGLLPASVISLFLSGCLAGLVSIEENFRVYTMRSVSDNET